MCIYSPAAAAVLSIALLQASIYGTHAARLLRDGPEPNFADLKRSVLRISITARKFHWFQPFNDIDEYSSMGSGFLVGIDPPTICTCAHVVADADQVHVQVPMFGKTKFIANVVTINNDVDVALLVIQEPQKLMDALAEANITIKALKLASRTPLIGHHVVAPGFPNGQDTMTLSMGVLSGVDHVEFHHRALAIQSTAIISPGNSGSPLLDEETGEIIGMNYAKLTGESQINYVVPLWTLKQVMLMFDRVQREKIQTPYQFRVVEHGLVTTPGSDALYLLASGKDTCSSGPMIAAMSPSSPFRGAKPSASPNSFLVSVDGVELDRYGQGAKNVYFDEKVDFDDLMRMRGGTGEEEIAFKTCDASTGKVQLHRMNLTWNAEHPAQGLKYLYEPWHEGVDWEIFGDLLFMDLTENHIRLLGSGWGFDHLLEPDEKINPKLVVIVANGGGEAEEALSLWKGYGFAIVKTVNGHDVTDLSGLRRYFIPKHMSTAAPPAKVSQDQFEGDEEVPKGKIISSEVTVKPAQLHQAEKLQLRGGRKSFGDEHRAVLDGTELLWSVRIANGMQFVALFNDTLAAQAEAAKNGATHLFTPTATAAMAEFGYLPDGKASDSVKLFAYSRRSISDRSSSGSFPAQISANHPLQVLERRHGSAIVDFAPGEGPNSL